MKEVWKPIDDMYEVSNKGRFRSVYYYSHITKKKYPRVRILKQHPVLNGYLKVSLHGKGCYAHRVVAKIFLENPNNLEQINHKDGNKQNNCVENLEWVTRIQNMNHAKDNGLNVAMLENTPITSKPVIQFNLETGEEIARFKSTKDVQRKFGYRPSNISRACNGLLKSYHGYGWKYERSKS